MESASENITVLLERARERLAEQIVARQYALEAEIWARYGEAGRQKGIQDVKDHLTFLIAAVKADDPSLFRDYVNWIKVVFAGLNFPAQVMRTTLTCARAEFHATLQPASSAVLDSYLDVGLATQAGAFEAYTRRAAAIDPAFSGPDEIGARLRTAAGYEAT